MIDNDLITIIVLMAMAVGIGAIVALIFCRFWPEEGSR